MISSPSRTVAIYVDRACTEHWIVRDPDGNFWIVPSVENAWEYRRPFEPTEETALEAGTTVELDSTPAGVEYGAGMEPGAEETGTHEFVWNAATDRMEETAPH